MSETQYDFSLYEKNAERRRHKRYNIYLPLKVSGTTASGSSIVEDTVTINISNGGCLFYSRHPFRKGSQLLLTILRRNSSYYSAQTEEMEIPAFVVWKGRVGWPVSDDQGAYSIAVKLARDIDLGWFNGEHATGG